MLFVDHEVARRLELCHAWRSVHHARAYKALHPDSCVQIEAVGSGVAVFEKPASPLNRCGGMGLEGAVDEADIERVEHFYESRHERARISLCPLADASLAEALRARGYSVEQFYTVLARPLNAADAALQLPQGMAIERTTPELAGAWLDTVARGFSAPDEPDADMLEILAPNFYAANATTFLAYLDEQPAGGGGMYIHNGVVEFGGASTLLPYRRRGVQSALLQARMQAAYQEGCDLATVHTSPGSSSQRNLQRLGFQVAYTLAVVVAP